MPTDHYLFGPFRLDCGSRELRRGEQAVALTPKAFDLLHALVISGGCAIEKTALMKQVWPDSFVSEDSLTQNIATLRKALGDAPDRQDYIVTVPRHGYRFAAPVHTESWPAIAGGEAVRSTPARRLTTTIAVASFVAASVVALHVRATRPNPPPILRFVVTPPEGTTFSPSASSVALSPDGRWLAFLASRPGQESRLWVRALDSLTARELTGTDGALGPFWSADSRWLAFFAKGALRKVDVLGGSPQTLCEAILRNAPSGTWHANGVILFTQPKGLHRTSAAGGAARQVTSVNAERGETAHILPQFLPDGRHFVYTTSVVTTASFESWIVLGSLDSADDGRLLTAQSQALPANGYLLFLRDGSLLAQPFDPARLQSGEPLPIPGAEHVGFNPATPRGMFTVSQNGILAYRTAPVRELEWLDRRGNAQGWIGLPGDSSPALSHDGRRVAVARLDSATGTRSLWILDSSRGGVASRFTSRTPWENCAVWSPDDTRIIFASGAPNEEELHEKMVNGLTEERVLSGHVKGCPIDWSRDGRYLLYSVASLTRSSGATARGVWALPVAGNTEPEALDGTQASEPRGPRARISPNGRWLAFESDRSGRREIYVRSFPNGANEMWQISQQGGIDPQWRGDGRELFFIGADSRLMAVPIVTEHTFRAETPVALFETGLDPLGIPISGRNQYLVTDDGQRFLLNQPRRDASPPAVTVVVNWQEELKQRVPTR